MAQMPLQVDRMIIGAGLYGLYSALYCGKRGERVIVLEMDDAPFGRATYINQARVHQGYHYPRALATAMKSAGYFERFNRDFDFCINREFTQIYATSGSLSWTDGRQFLRFCRAAGIPCEELHPDRYFRSGACDGAFLTREYSYDAAELKSCLLEKLSEYPNVSIRYGCSIREIENTGSSYLLRTEGGFACSAPFVLNATYASINQILRMADFHPFQIKYELCEIILCSPSEKLRPLGLTVMDGPFFSVMPFGKTGLHSLTSVAFTPHLTSFEELPSFSCQERCGRHCSTTRLGNCNTCPARPETAFPYMAGLARKYLREEYDFEYVRSLYSMKPILRSSEIDDSRPTVIVKHTDSPRFISVLSGKINTIYDLDEVLSEPV